MTAGKIVTVAWLFLSLVYVVTTLRAPPDPRHAARFMDRGGP